jgi:putative ABC transport system permease protein
MEFGPMADDLPEELAFHLDELKQERLALGDTEAQADRFARIMLGNRTSVHEAVHEISPFYFLEIAARHVQIALRTLFRQRGGYLAAIGIPALGIGMSVAMFSLVDAVLIRPLPFPGQELIRVIWKADPLAGPHVEELAYPELRDLQENITEFEYAAVMPTSLYGYGQVLQVGGAEPVQIEAAPVSHDFFRVLGVSPAQGRNFTSSDERVNAPPVVIVSDRVWRQQLGGDPRVVGRLIRLSGKGYTVIGVMAPGVEFPRGAGLWLPLGVESRIVDRRGATFLQAIVRLKSPQSKVPESDDRIAHRVNELFERLAADYPAFYSKSQHGVVTPLVEYWTGSARVHLWIMLGASLLLLIASIITGGILLLSRTLSRQHEISTRVALGAGRGQILWQLAAEGMVVATISAAAGLGIAEAAIRALVRWAPPDIPRLADATLNLHTFWFAAAVAAFAAVGCAVVPGWFAVRMHPESALREGGSRSSRSRRGARTRNVFILAQAAVTVMLLAIAALLVLSYRSMMAANTGFANREALTMNLQLRSPEAIPVGGTDVKASRSFYTNLLSRLRQAPGVTSAAGVLVRPLEGTIGWDVPYQFEFETSQGSNHNLALPKANYEVVTPDYFKTVGTPLLEGRDFDDHDLETGNGVAIIDETLAERIRAAGHSPLGYRVHLGLGGWKKVIGVCADARYRSITARGVDIFVPYLQAAPPTNYLVIRGTRGAGELSALVRRTVAQIDSRQAIASVATIGELIDGNAARHRFNMILLLWFAICAAILAASGVYSVIAETMVERRTEIAIKIALGCKISGLIREIVSGTLGLVLAGEVLGLGGASGAGSLFSDLLYGVSPHDPLILAFMGVCLFAVSLIAAFWPAWIAAGRYSSASLRAS